MTIIIMLIVVIIVYDSILIFNIYLIALFVCCVCRLRLALDLDLFGYYVCKCCKDTSG